MKLRTLLNLSLVVGMLSPAYGLFAATSCGADTLPAPVVQESTPELDFAGHRVEQAKLKLDQARQQLSAARAMLKAADAEYKAARADKDALAARTEAKKLADASGLKDDGVTPVQPSNDFGASRLYPASQAAAVPATPDSSASTTRIQDLDVHTFTKMDVAPGVTTPDAHATSVVPPVASPAVAPELRPTAVEQPASVP